jgi:hypothetical protein
VTVRWRRRGGEEQAPETPGPARPPAQDRELVARRDQLTEQFALLQTELGGVFYEMAIRDHIRLEVLTAKAAALQRVDTELAEAERLLGGDDGPVTGSCPSCGAAQHARARFCSHCGDAFEATPQPA